MKQYKLETVCDDIMCDNHNQLWRINDCKLVKSLNGTTISNNAIHKLATYMCTLTREQIENSKICGSIQI